MKKYCFGLSWQITHKASAWQITNAELKSRIKKHLRCAQNHRVAKRGHVRSWPARWYLKHHTDITMRANLLIPQILFENISTIFHDNQTAKDCASSTVLPTRCSRGRCKVKWGLSSFQFVTSKLSIALYYISLLDGFRWQLQKSKWQYRDNLVGPGN